MIVSTAYPVRYFVRARMTNRTLRPVYIREITLAIETQLPLASTETEVKRLEPGELADLTLIFPVEPPTATWTSGRFVLSVIPTRGRPRRISGAFPVPRHYL